MFCEITRLTEKIVKTAEHHGITLTNSGNLYEVTIPENSTWLLVSNLEKSPESEVYKILKI